MEPSLSIVPTGGLGKITEPYRTDSVGRYRKMNLRRGERLTAEADQNVVVDVPNYSLDPKRDRVARDSNVHCL